MAGSIWNVPYNRNSHFIGREQDLVELRQNLSSADLASHAQVICGLGGIGKTQLALEYAYRHQNDYAITWWINADEPANIALAFAKLAQRLSMRIPDGTSLDDIRHAVRRNLNARADWLLIFDNAPSPEEIKNYIPMDRAGHVLITSRNPSFSGVGKPFMLRTWKRADSLKFLQKRTGVHDPTESAAKLAQALGDLPLALEQAAACIEQSQLTFEEYLRLFEQHWAELLSSIRPSGDYPDTVAMTWNISFVQVHDADPAAAEMMNLCAFFGADDIPKSLIMDGAAGITTLSTLTHAIILDKAIGSLRTYSLIDANERSISIHRLVSAIVRDRMQPDERATWCEAALDVIARNFRFESRDLATWEPCAALLPHALAAAGHAEAVDVAPRTAVAILDDAGRYLYKRAQFAEAKEVLERALALATRALGENHPRVSVIANNLGRVLKETGDVAQSRALFEQALAIDQSIYGESADPHLASVANNYGISLQASGDPVSAKAQFEWARQLYETNFGENHPKLASIINNLGYVAKSSGEIDAARMHFERALEIAQANFGDTHPLIGSILTNLADAQQLLGDTDSAKQNLERAITLFESAHGETHPAISRALGHLATLLQKQSDPVTARIHLERALAIDTAVHGPDHAFTTARREQLERLMSQSETTDSADL